MGKTGALGLIVVAYLACLAAGAVSLMWLPVSAPWNALIADIVATLVIFGFSRRYRNSSFYDAYWSVIPPLLAAYWMATYPASTRDPRAWIVTALVWFWAIRLTTNWALHWSGLQHEDWRYPLVRARAGKAAMWADLFGIHLFPTIQVFLGCLAIYAVMSRTAVPLSLLDALAGGVTFGAVVIELVADLQLHAFIAQRKQPGGFITTGLWAWSRHPNYFGELGFWWGLMLFGLIAAPQDWWWIVPGALAMTAMFVFASIPLMDARSCERRPAYAEHMKRISALLPLPPRN
jgi:steroid 5-alpha reductase family enzyme